MILSVAEATSMLTTAQVMSYTYIVVFALTVLLALKALMGSETENKRVKSFVKGSNIAIVSLLLIFVVVVVYRVMITPL